MSANIASEYTNKRTVNISLLDCPKDLKRPHVVAFRAIRADFQTWEWDEVMYVCRFKSHERRLELPYLLAKPQRYMNAPWSNRSAREHADHHGVWLVPNELEGEDTERLSGMESFENDGQGATIAGHRSWEVLIARHVWFEKVSETIGFRIPSRSQWKTAERTFVHIDRCRGLWHFLHSDGPVLDLSVDRASLLWSKDPFTEDRLETAS